MESKSHKVINVNVYFQYIFFYSYLVTYEKKLFKEDFNFLTNKQSITRFRTCQLTTVDTPAQFEFASNDQSDDSCQLQEPFQ